MRFVIVTGMSGAGKSTALKMLEDAEYFCVDNLPIPLVEKFAQLTADGTSGEIQKVAVGIDIRSGQALPDLQNVLEWMSINGICYEILFLDASDDVLVKRYKETRRTHPLAGLGRVDEGIRKERKALEFLKKDADYILDTSQLLTRELKAELDKIFVQDQKFKNLMITVLSFGFKYGIPADSDLVFDVRFLPNPYYVEGMRPLSGNDAPVRDYVMGFETAQVFAEKLEDMIRFLIPNYISEGKHQLIISIGWIDNTPCSCGRTHGRIHINGRKDDMFIVSAVNVFPSDIEAVIRERSGITGEYLTRVFEKDFTCKYTVEVEKSGDNTKTDDEVAAEVSAALKARIGVKPYQVVVHPDGGLNTRSEHKSKRIIDERKLHDRT